jgi:hypothetical protein
MPAVDQFSGAQSSAEAQKRALLQAVAQQGSQGRAVYDQQQAAAQDARKQALKAAAGPSPTPQAVATPTASPAYNGGGSDASAAQAADNQFSSTMAAANGNYFDQVAAAIPLTDQLIQAFQKEQDTNHWNDTITANQARDDEARRRQWELEDRNYQQASQAEKHKWDTEDRYYEVALRNAKATAVNPLARLVDSLGGSGLAKPQLAAAIKEAFTRAQSSRPQKERVGGKLISETVPGQKMDKKGKNAVLAQVTTDLGLPDGVLAQFLGKANPALPAKPTKAASKPSKAMVEDVRSKPIFHQSVDVALNNIRSSMEDDKRTLSEARAFEINEIRSDPYMAAHPILRDLVIEAIRG